MCKTFTCSEITNIHRELESALKRFYGDKYERLNSYFEIAENPEFDIIVYLQFMDPDGMIQSIGRYVKK